MNKDLDDRLLPVGEYRNAVNAQVRRSEGPNAGALENVLGNVLSADFRELTNNDNLFSIGYCTDEINNRVFLFLTDNTGFTYKRSAGSGKTSYIVVYNANDNVYSILVNGDFLNFSTQFPITGVNILENLLFWTDNRNQPRVINVDLANQSNSANPTYYTTEEQISVAKYNPYQPIELYRPAFNVASSVTSYETSMYDVVSKYYPDGGSGLLTQNYISTNGSPMRISKATYKGDLIAGATVAYIKDGVFVETSVTVSSVVGVSGGSNDAYFTVTLSGSWQIEGQNITLNTGEEVIFNYNPCFEIDYNGDKDYLKDLFVRFAYRFKFEDGSYSIMSPFTQECFIPSQDGYFMQKINSDNTTSNSSTTAPSATNSPILDITDEEDTYRSTVVEFMENKVNKIILRIPLPTTSSLLNSAFKIEEIDILYKQSNQTTIYVVESLPLSRITGGYGRATVNGATTSTDTVVVDGVSGSIKAGALVSGTGVVNNPVVVSYNGSTQVVLSTPQSLSDNTNLTFGDANIFEYEYQSTKPYKLLPASETTRTYDKVPVRALAQEIISNRVVYGNFLDKHTPPASIDYNVVVSPKSDFSLGIATTTNTNIIPGNTAAGNSIAIAAPTGSWTNGYIVTSDVVGAIPANTVIATNSGTSITLSADTNNVAIPAASNLTFTAPNSVRNTTSKVEYPNSSLKQNRNYQVGIVLSDKFGRQSTVILSDGDSSVKFSNESFLGSTVYADYIDSTINATTFPGESLKVLFNNPIAGGTTGIYNGDPTSEDYNPLGWYSYKIVVKQTEQEYYNVYLPGVMAAYPEDATKELGKTSHTVLFSDNINKVPRDLVEVGPEQKQFRSSVILHGRVQNSNSNNVFENNEQYYPGKKPPIVSMIATDSEMFNGIATPGYTGSDEFYNINSNPLIGRISTPSKQFGIPAAVTTAEVGNPSTSGPLTEVQVVTASINPLYYVGVNPMVSLSIDANQVVSGNGIVDGTKVVSTSAGSLATLTKITLDTARSVMTVGDVLTFSPTLTGPVADPWLKMPQLAVMETDPVDSDLDIFWETTTAGLVSELNQAISGGTAEGVSFGFNTDNFDEEIKPGTGGGNNPNMCSADFNILDVFGNDITYAVTNPPQFQLSEVRDYQNNIIDSTNFFDSPADPNAPFKLVRNGNKYNVEVQDTFYYSNQASSKDTYSFEFEINYPVDGVNQQTFITKQPIALINKAPVILAATCTGNTTYVPGTGAGGGLPIGTFRNIQATNGAAFGIGITANAWKDLTWKITVTKGGVDYGPDGEGDVFITQSQVNNYWQGSMRFTGGDTPNNMVDGTYACVATVEDAGSLTAQCTFDLIIDRTPCYTYRFTYTGSNSAFSLNYTDCLGETANVSLGSNVPANTFPGYLEVCGANNQTTLTNAGFVKLALGVGICG